mgnify:FL=1
MDSAEIRRRWLDFFEVGNSQQLRHTIVPSASLIADDPNLLLVNAGMVPFKPYFLGEIAAPYPRATSVQKCVRTLDIDEVGKTTRHASFFQMCGNFSFGDYFKEGAIGLAWDLLTKSTQEGGYGFPESKLWVTVYHDDDEAAEIWHKVVGVPKDRIQRRGMADNFWSMGVPGPCGPCSEIYFDRGPSYGKEGGPVADEDRYLEVWNLVFMQYERGAGSGKDDFPILGELPAKNIDTGLGLERTAALLQGVDNIYEIDTTKLILDRASEITGKNYGVDPVSDVRLRVIADHARTSAMLIGDGVTPGNEGRGYVLRRMMRRTIRNMRLLGAHDPVMKELIDVSIDAMSPQYPELKVDASRIVSVSQAEEATFLQTLKSGTTILDTAVNDAKRKGSIRVSGDDAFKLHDTYGFPIDLTLEMAAEAGLQVDADGFKRLMKEQKERAKADAKSKKSAHADLSAYREILDKTGSTNFVGYEKLEMSAAVTGLLKDGKRIASAVVGDEVEVVLDNTPFYAEGGGQLADGGIIKSSGAIFEVDDVQSPVSGLIVHRGRVLEGEFNVKDQAFAQVDTERRAAISRSHTATHLVHKAFREFLGETATQAGSENAPGRFRFDFAATGAIPQSMMHDVEAKVNDVLSLDLAVSAQSMSIAEAKALGAMALFGEKYGEIVRVISVGDWTSELCGGTHAKSSGQLGVVKLLGESSIGAGVRRIEALVGNDAYRFLAREYTLFHSLTEIVKGTRTDELPDRISALVERLKEVEKEISSLKSNQLLGASQAILDKAVKINEIVFISHTLSDGFSSDDARNLTLHLRDKNHQTSCVVAIGGQSEGKPFIIVATNEASRKQGAKAGQLVKIAATVLGGGGGGKDDLAQGGGVDAVKMSEAISQISDSLRSLP